MKQIGIISDEWNKISDRYYGRIYSDDTIDHIISDPIWVFPADIRERIITAFPDLHGKSVLVPSSGDNGAVFAFHLLGAKVTSVDLSERQIYNAKKIAVEKGWDIEFILDNSMKLEKISSSKYDLVYTSNGVHVWINDLISMYHSFLRVLKPGGSYIMFETHPFCRPFDGNAADDGKFIVNRLYENIGPFGDVPTYGWRIMDLANAMLDAGFWRINRTYLPKLWIEFDKPNENGFWISHEICKLLNLPMIHFNN